MDKQKLLKKLNEALILEEVDLIPKIRSVTNNTKDRKLLQVMNRLLEDTARHSEVLARLSKYALAEDKNEF